MRLHIGEVGFEVATDRSGIPLFARTYRPSQQGDPGDLVAAEWKTWGPDFNSFEQIALGGAAGPLSRDYGEDTDGRWDGLDMLAPLVTAVTLTGFDRTWSPSIPGTVTFIPGEGQMMAQDYLLTLSPDGFWGLGEAAGDALDGSGNGNDGTVTLGAGARDATAVDYGGDGSIDFDGATVGGTLVQLPNVAGLTDIWDGGGALWFAGNADGAGAFGVGRIVENGKTFLIVRASGGLLRFEFNVLFSGTDPLWVTDYTLAPGDRFFGAVQYDSGDVANNPTLWLWDETNGLQALTVGDGLTESATPTGTRTADTAGFTAGNNAAGTRTWDGLIDEVAIWKGSQPSLAEFTKYANRAAAIASSVATLIPGAPGVAEEASGMAQIAGPDATYGYVVRGSYPTKVDLSDFSVARSGELLAEPATSVIATRNRDASTREVAVGMKRRLYRVLTAVNTAGAADTWADNAAGQVVHRFAQAPDRVVGMDTVANQVLGNILTGSVTMAAPNWSTTAQDVLTAESAEFTGFALDGDQWVVGASDGPYVLDDHTRDFFPVIPEVDNHADNCFGATNWSYLGAIIPLHHSLRYQKSLSGRSFGPEVFASNTSPVHGHAHGFAASSRWGYAAFHNPVTDDTWLCAGRVREPGDPHPYPVSWFVVARFTGVHCKFLNFIGTVNGLRSVETLVGGYGTNMFWLQEGHTTRFPDDPAYTTALAGTTYLTELRRNPGVVKDVEAVEFETEDCALARTVTVGLSLDGAAAVTFPAVKADGFVRQHAATSDVPDAAFHGARRIKPQIAYASNVSTVSPKVAGTLTVYYRIRPLTVRVYSFTLDLDAVASNTHTVEELEEALYAYMRSSGPVTLEDPDRDSVYVRVNSVTVVTRADASAGNASGAGQRRLAEVVATEWSVA